MSWEEDWEKYAEEDSSSSEDEAVKQLRREAELERNKPKKKSLAQRKAEEEAARLAEQAKIDAEVRELRRKQQEIRAKLGADATPAQIDKAMQEASALEDVRDLFAAPAGAAAAVVVAPTATSCDVDLLDLIGEEEHAAFGEKLALKLGSMSTGPYIVAFVESLLKKLEPSLQAADYNSISKAANVLQNTKTQKQKKALSKGKKKKKEKPKLNTGVKSVSKGGYDDFMGDDGAGNYYDDAHDGMW